MALIGEIRRRSWVLIFFIGLGMGGFILMDMMGNASRGNASGGTVGEIEGREISQLEFNRLETVRNNRSVNSYQNRELVWNQLVAESLLEDEAEEVGIGISGAELKELLFGSQISPLVYQEFYNQQTGQFDIESVKTSHKNFVEGKLTQDGMSFFRDLETRIVADQIGNKLVAMTSKAMYTPTWMAAELGKSQSQTAAVSFVQIPYEEVDEEVNITDAEIDAYMKENKSKYMLDEETRTVELVVFDVVPSSEDSAKVRTKIADLAAEFRTVEDDSAFIVSNYGVYDTKYAQKSELSPVVADTLMKIPTGTVYGPYLDNGFFRAVKLVDRRQVRDSVQMRHIVRSVENLKYNPEGVKAARKFLQDSVISVLNAGNATFEELATKYGQDGTRANGGDLGMLSADINLPSLRNLAFYEAEPNKLYTVVTDLGVHVIEVTKVVDSGATGVRVAYVDEVIVPSRQTIDFKNKEAFNFVRDNRTKEVLNKTVAEKNMTKREATVKLNDYDLFGADVLPGETSRNVVKWAFKARKGDVSPDLYAYSDPVNLHDDKYVIAALASVNPAGLSRLQEDRNAVANILRNKKKAELVAGKTSGKELQAIAEEYGTTMESVPSVNVGGTTPGGLGGETKVLASAFALQSGGTTKPIAGNKGIYVVRLDSAPSEAAVNTEQIKTQESSTMRNFLGRSGTSGALIDALVKKADVEDNRAKYY